MQDESELRKYGISLRAQPSTAWVLGYTNPHGKYRVTPMKFTTKACLVLAGFALTSVGIAAAPAHANDWDYSIDSFNDGQQGSSPSGPIVGANSAFEMYGLALKATADTVYVAINSNLGLAGYSSNRAEDGNIGYGDLFLNFTGSDKFAGAEGDSNLFGIRFAGTNGTDVATGVYSGVTSEDATAANAGFESLNQHKSQINARGGTPSFGDLDWTGTGNGYTQYFGPTNQKRQFATSIASGTKIGDVEMLSEAQLADLDFGQYGAVGDHTFGFSFDRSLLPEAGGDFVAHLVAECLNDGLAMIGHIPPVTRVDIPDPSQEAPEPALASGLLLLGGLGVLKRRAQQKTEMG
jgi:hypothetical protein